jgi:hypothetical protein
VERRTRPCQPPRTEPPAKQAPPTADNQHRLATWLAEVNARTATAAPWLFYRELDQYLGGWGGNGYLLGYGLRYCRRFCTDPILQQHPQARAWVRRTSILLQDDMGVFMLARFRVGRLASLNDDELSQRAFAGHARAYAEAGLAQLVRSAPHVVPRIVAIPGREFLPWAKHARRSWSQALQVAAMTVRDSAACADVAGPSRASVWSAVSYDTLADVLPVGSPNTCLRLSADF